MIQAAVPSIARNSTQILKDLSTPQNLLIDPSNLITADGIALLDDANVVIRGLQNVGTTAVRWVCDADNNPDINNFHGVLQAGDALDDGKGGSVDLSGYRGTIRIAAAAGSPRVAPFIARRGPTGVIE